MELGFDYGALVYLKFVVLLLLIIMIPSHRYTERNWISLFVDSAAHNAMNLFANTSFTGKCILCVERCREKLIS